MMPFQYIDYRDYFREEINARKKLESSINFQNMANAMRIQKPFLSKVINGHSHLTNDQLFLACKYLKLSEVEVEYIELNHDFQTSSLKVRQEKLKRELELVQQRHMGTDKYIETSDVEVSGSQEIKEYYLDPVFQLVHVAMSVERYRRNLKLLALETLIPEIRILKAVTRLEELCIIKREGAELKVIAHNLYLPKDSKEFMAWSTQIRLAGMQRAQNLPKEDSYGFSVIFSTDELTRKKIQEKFLKFISEVQKMVGDGREENVYQLNFDLFNWNQPISVGRKEN